LNTNLCEIGFVLDRSGSMNAMKEEAIGGINAFLESQQKLPGEARLTMVLFDHEYIVAHDGVPIKDVPPLDSHSYVPRGTTALLDAIGRTINTIGERLGRTPEPDRPGKVIVAILTDGLENASQEFKRKEIFKMIKHQREVYSWEFVFLGAKQDAISTGAKMGIPIANAVTFSEAPGGTARAFEAVSSVATAYRAGESDYARHLSKAAKEKKP
jgi:uncharacterized protein YegL